MAYPFERMTTEKLNSLSAKRRDIGGKSRKQTQCKRFQLEKKTETNSSVLPSRSEPSDSER